MDVQLKILVVDDEENIRFAVSNILKANNYDVVTVSDGDEAFLEIKKQHYDFVLCDVKMPKIDGMEFLRALQRHKIDTTVIMMSAYGNIDAAIEAIKQGAYDYIPKPFTYPNNSLSRRFSGIAPQFIDTKVLFLRSLL